MHQKFWSGNLNEETTRGLTCVW